ncbi:MAG TPA: hypothetical protein VH143_06180 [Kofleriaceae bacterium]|jgi:uncharacterized delta-60 repeat protein|nr:hypothetical protein [Kofleriaceae bacterium]
MRAAPLFAIAMACGRIGFDERARPDATVNDAATCDALACLDRAFGVVTLMVDGVATGGYGDQGIALDAANRLVVTGKGSRGVLVARLEDSGVLDPSFGGSGYIEIAATNAQGLAITVAPDGDIVVAGNSNGAGLVAKLDATGAVDPAFGVIMPTFGATADALNGVLVDSSGRVIAGGQGDVSSFDLFAGAWLADGSADPAFSQLHYDGGNGDEFGTLAASLAPDGGLDLVGQTFNGGNFDGLILHTTNEGVLDPQFGSGGVVTTDLGKGERYLALIRDSGGNIVIAGEQDALTASPYQQAIIERYSSEGALDTTFAQPLLDFGGSDVGRGVVELGDGRLVVGLRHGDGSRLVVMTAGGSVIGTFDLPIATTPNGIDDVILDRSGRVLVFGDAGAGSAAIYVARVLVP